MVKARNDGAIVRSSVEARHPVRMHLSVLSLLLALATSPFGTLARAQEVAPVSERPHVAVLPFRIHSAGPVGYLTESLSDLLATRMEATGKVDVMGSQQVMETLGPSDPSSLSEDELKNLARRLAVNAVISGSLTELAGRFSLDVRMTEAGPARSESIVIIAQSEEDLLGRLSELADRAVAALSGTDPSKILAVRIEGAGEIEGALRGTLEFFAGSSYEPAAVREDRARIEEHPGVASVSLDVERKPNGVELIYKIVRSERLFGATSRNREGDLIGEVVIRGNRRIDAEAIQTRVGSSVGTQLNELQVAADIKSIFELGFFRDVRAFVDLGEDGKILIFEVQENPVVREITISGNDKIEAEEIKEILTVTTGSTLDRALLTQNSERIGALYRAKGFYLATSGYTVEEIVEGSVAIHFEVEENKKLHLEKLIFEGNTAFDDSELREDFATELWHPWSWATGWFDKSGTYSEPVFMRDLRGVERIYSDSGYLQVEIDEPQVDASEDGLSVTIVIREGKATLELHQH
jgi:TolB-like protein